MNHWRLATPSETSRLEGGSDAVVCTPRPKTSCCALSLLTAGREQEGTAHLSLGPPGCSPVDSPVTPHPYGSALYVSSIQQESQSLPSASRGVIFLESFTHLTWREEHLPCSPLKKKSISSHRTAHFILVHRADHTRRSPPHCLGEGR